MGHQTHGKFMVDPFVFGDNDSGSSATYVPTTIYFSTIFRWCTCRKHAGESRSSGVKFGIEGKVGMPH
jgi:hypothetical protein